MLLAAGALAATGFQPLMLWPLTLAAFALLLALLDGAPRARDAAWASWLFGVGHFTLGNNWIATAFTYQAQMPAWLGWVAVVLLSFYLAIFPMLAALGGWWLHRRAGLALIPSFAACWTISELMRGRAFTGFPWNPLAAVALGPFDRPGLAGLAAWCGTYALSGGIVLLAGLWLIAWREWHSGRRIIASALALVPAALFMVPHGGAPGDSPIAYTLVQPNIGQDQINDASRYESQFQTLASLSRRLPVDGSGARVVLWPEGAVPDYLRPGYDAWWYQQTTYGGDPAIARERMGRVIGPNSLLMTGATDLSVEKRQVNGAWNVITLLDSSGAIRGNYAKAHLVPYGEYLPMRDFLTPIGLSRLVSGDLDFQSGPGPQTLDLGDAGEGGWGHPGFQICYEIVFSGEVTDPTRRPDYIFNPSNDGWFGAWGPPQHLAQARLRAIEEGIPVLRSTTTGISAVIDAGGAVRAFIPRHAADRRDGRIPAALPPTLFARLGNILALGWAIVVLLLTTVATRRRAR
ncbi:apolipoprotein N-acyltransferase [Novosphingobium nitrogenifigens DSM 19370]|uniref:Apolipoprotein N-acyltransferase n=1 Tax=Novosphingobium nitrogenifigens DSM 19370 TaxID=983920 RepID=F1Z6N5_9SPHN|nr:apolipoprotein N-acyltransferase [Novosphingobium nitrogenifigens DSM 19370]